MRDVLAGLEVRGKDDDDNINAGMPSRAKAELGDSPKMRKLAAIGLALSRLSQWQRSKVEVTWILRRQYQWWASQSKNKRRCVERRIPSANPEWILLHLTAREIRQTADYFQDNYRRAYRAKITQQGLARLDELRAAGWGGEVVGLGSEGLR